MQFFVNDDASRCALYERSVPLISHPEGMVRTAALTALLNVHSVDCDLVKRCVARRGAARRA